MGISRHFQRARPASSTHEAQPTSKLFWPLFASNFVLSALSISNLGLISSMVGWLLDQKHNVHSYKINWPQTPFRLNVEPANLWVDQGHESNGVAGYGFFLGLFGMFVAWRYRKAARPLRTLTILLILLFLAVLFTLSAFIFVFVVTYQTTGQSIRVPIAANNQFKNYAEFSWTPETWFKAVLDLPIANSDTRKDIESHVTNMVAWRWMLLPIFITDCVAFGVTLMAWLGQRRRGTVRADSIEK